MLRLAELPASRFLADELTISNDDDAIADPISHGCQAVFRSLVGTFLLRFFRLRHVALRFRCHVDKSIDREATRQSRAKKTQ